MLKASELDNAFLQPTGAIQVLRAADIHSDRQIEQLLRFAREVVKLEKSLKPNGPVIEERAPSSEQLAAVVRARQKHQAFLDTASRLTDAMIELVAESDQSEDLGAFVDQQLVTLREIAKTGDPKPMAGLLQQLRSGAERLAGGTIADSLFRMADSTIGGERRTLERAVKLNELLACARGTGLDKKPPRPELNCSLVLSANRK